MERPLVVLTRPEKQNQRLVECVQRLGAEALEMPWLRVSPTADTDVLQHWWKESAPTKMSIVFVSATAVHVAIPHGALWPEHVWAVATGSGTAYALEHKGVPIERICYPRKTFDSESIWEECADCFKSGGDVTIFRGQEGRSWLGDQATKEGCRVEYYPVYSRDVCLEVVPLLQSLFEQDRQIIYVLTNSDAANKIIPLVPSTIWQNSRVVVPHFRIEKTVKALGIPYVVLTPGGDEGICERLVQILNGS